MHTVNGSKVLHKFKSCKNKVLRTFPAALDGGVQGMLQYQWSQPNLMASPGTNVVPTVPGTGTSPIVPGTGLSPNDGYGTQGVG